VSPFLAVARSGLAAVLLHPLRSFAIVASVVSLLLPFTAGTAISEGLGDEAAAAADHGADLVVAGMRYGRPAPVPLESLETLAAIPGVTAVRPRIVGMVELGAAREPAVLVGVVAGGLPENVSVLEGRLAGPGGAAEIVVGSRLAKRLRLAPGSRVPPFYRNREGERVMEVTGVFRADLPMWEANLVLTSLENAQAIFDERGTATQFLVTCREGYADAVRESIRRLPTLAAPGAAEPLLPRILSREDLRALLVHRTAFGAGVFSLHFLLLFAAAIPLLVVATGAGLRERRRETGILKMLGWGTDEVLLRAFVESLVLALLSAALSVLLAAAWLGPLGARGLAFVFLPEADIVPGFAVPWRLAPGPLLLAAALSLALVLVGTLYSSWRAASAEPMEAMR